MVTCKYYTILGKHGTKVKSEDNNYNYWKLCIIILTKIYNRSEERKVRGSGVGDEDCTDDVSSGAGATSPAASPRPDDDGAQSGGSGVWPSMQDLNTRLRRLITAYQRNYKREELKLQQRAKVILFNIEI